MTSTEAPSVCDSSTGNGDTYLMALLSHEIRTPLHSLQGILELLSTTALDNAQKELLRIGRDSARGLARVADDMLDLTGLRANRIAMVESPVDLRQMVEDLAALARMEHPACGLAIHAHYPAGEPRHFLVDPLRLRQVLLNLVSNAVKFTKAGEVRIRVAVEESVDASETWRAVSISVIDSGIGMSPSALQQAWRPFRRVHADATQFPPGSGLGLTIARQLAKCLGGELLIHSRIDVGTTACLHLRLQQPRQAHQAPSVATGNTDTSTDTDTGYDADSFENANAPTASVLVPRPVMQRAPYRLLIVDDHPSSRLLLQIQLRQLGYRFSSVKSGEAALAALKKYRFDLMLTDCRLPGVDGFGLTQAWRSMEQMGAPAMPVIGLSAYPLSVTASACNHGGHDVSPPQDRLGGMDEYLLKPVSLLELRQVLDNWLDNRARPPNKATPTSALPASPAPTWAIDLTHLEQSLGGPVMLDKLLRSFVGTTSEDVALLRKSNQQMLTELASSPVPQQTALRKPSHLKTQTIPQTKLPPPPSQTGMKPNQACRMRLHRIVGGLLILGSYELAHVGTMLETCLPSNPSAVPPVRAARAIEQFCEDVENHIRWIKKARGRHW